MSDKERFDAALAASVCPQGEQKIGLLGEKILHTTIKNYIDPDVSHQEVRVGRFYADVKNEDGIFEVQTAALDRLRRKLPAFLEAGPVTVVYPIAHVKYISWIDPQTGENTPPRRSPKLGDFSDALPEIGKIADLLGKEGLRILLLLIDADEYRLLNGWDKSGKRGSCREKLVPAALYDSFLVKDPSDLRPLLPERFPQTFTAGDVKKAFGFRDRKASFTIRALTYAGIARRIGKNGRAFVYEIIEKE